MNTENNIFFFKPNRALGMDPGLDREAMAPCKFSKVFVQKYFYFGPPKFKINPKI